MNMSENVKRLRRKEGLTLRELAKKSNLAYGAIGNIERGVIKDPNLSTVIKLAKAFNISINELISNEEELVDND